MEAEPRNFLILGHTFAGKSVLACRLAREISRDLVVIVSTRLDPSYLQRLDHSKARFLAVRSESYLVDPGVLKEARTAGKRYLWLTVHDLSPRQIKEFLVSLVAAVRAVGNLALFLDEAHQFCKYTNVPEELVGFVRGARGFGVDVILISQRLKDIDVGLRCVLTHLFLFRTIEPMDLQVLRSEWQLGSVVDCLRGLPNRHFLIYNCQTNKKRWQSPIPT